MKHDFKRFLNSITPISYSEYEESIKLFKAVKLSKGDFFIRAGSVCRNIAYINYGTLRTFYLNKRGEDITSCFCTEQSLTTSYKSFITQEVSMLSIQALEDAELLLIDYDKMNILYNRSPVWQKIGRAVGEKEYIIMERYASILNNESAKMKYLRLMEEQPTVLQKASLEHIASYLGITRRTLSRIRQEMAQRE